MSDRAQDWFVRLVLFALVVESSVGLGLASREAWLAAPFVLGAIVALFLRVEGDMSQRAYLVLALPFVLLSIGHRIDSTTGLALTVPLYVSLYLEAIAIRQLASRAPRIPYVIFATASGVATSGPDAPVDAYRIVVTMFALTLAIALRLSVRPKLPAKLTGRAIVLGGAFLAVLGATFGSTRVLDHYYEDLSRAFLKAMGQQQLPSKGGFSGQAQLGSIVGSQQGETASNVTLRVFARRAPGHLRAKSFLDYEKGRWSEEGEQKTRAPEHGRFVLSGRPAPTTDPALLEAYPTSEYGRHFFLPLEASALETTSDVIRSFQGGALESPFDPTSNGYSVFVSKEPVTGDGWKNLPKDPVVLAALDSTLAKLPEAKTTFDLVAAIRDYFVQRYTYHYGITFNDNPDPIAQFLTEKDHGHCELFATAGALMLRRRGVQARYVTGFLCEEKNPAADDLWVARESHAHAWVEYFDRGWQTAEFTPDSGLPHFETASGLAAWIEALKGKKDRLVASFRKEGALAFVKGALSAAAAWLVLSWPGRLLLLVAIIFIMRRILKRLPARRAKTRERVLPAALEAERRRYLALERALARRGYARRPSETLEEFASRVPDDAAGRVRAYANLRYGVVGSRP